MGAVGHHSFDAFTIVGRSSYWGEASNFNRGNTQEFGSLMMFDLEVAMTAMAICLPSVVVTSLTSTQTKIRSRTTAVVETIHRVQEFRGKVVTTT